MNIVSLTLAVPYEGVPHAGGEYYLRHVQALVTRGHSVLLVAPETPENLAGARRAPTGVEVRIVPSAGGRLATRAERLRARVSPIRPPLGFAAGLARDAVVRRALADADLVEFQWTHVAAVLPVVRPRIAPSAALVGFAHDVVQQGFVRRAASGGRGARALARLRAAQASRLEPAVLNRLDAVLVFSEKDRDLLRALGVRARVQVVRPPLVTATPLARTVEPGVVLFVGAFNRDENVQGAEWLVDRVWPRVLAAHPGARLEIVGAHPTEGMRARAAAVPSVEVTGYVDDLGPLYRRAAVAVVPLLLGAGVKFKTATAIALGVPVVATAVGMEGVLEETGAPVDGIIVPHDAAAFAGAVVDVLDDSVGAAARADAVRPVAVRAFGAEGFTERLDTLYRELQATSGRRRR